MSKLFSVKDLEETRPGSKESKALTADWLQGEITICLTDEVRNEINLNPDQLKRQRGRDFALRFPTLVSPHEEVDNNLNALKLLLPKRPRRGDEADIRHLAHAIAGRAQFFVTRDSALLRRADEVRDRFGLSIVRPSELIVRIDELVREAEYQPTRVAGSLIRIGRVPSQQESDIVETFAQSENRSDFQQRLRAFLVEPQQVEASIVRDPDQHLLALLVYDRRTNHRLEIPIFRVADSYLGKSLTSHLILQTVLVAADERRATIKLSDPHLSESVERALQTGPFVRIGNSWIKFNLRTLETTTSLVIRLKSFEADTVEEREYLRAMIQTTTQSLLAKEARALLEVERALWPMKIVDLDIPIFIVPIKPEWAMHLFEKKMAEQTLFGAKPEIALNRENVYYRAAKPRVLSAPARILWYVSSSKKYQGAMHIRACSLIDEVTIGTPKDLSRQFRRLGIYEWKDILGIAKGHIDNQLMAVRFSDTELLNTPVPWKDLQHILAQVEGHRSQIQSPLHISNESFARIYSRGVQL